MVKTQAIPKLKKASRIQFGLKKTFPFLLLLILLPNVVFQNSLNNAFHQDDYYRILDNPGIEKIHPVWRHFSDPRTVSSIPEITQFRKLCQTFSERYIGSGRN